ncbi:colicin E5-related ribonuclease [Dehalogenimonas etheniformans]|uniref:colicin E5-related ribonuclease n=1 Tax=Dehalogenimonas etheniformans TaxID=1536648 RepID=UPI000E555DCB|nr:hypothetical protein HX448_03730 [Dehalogenimonas etheniformans]
MGLSIDRKKQSATAYFDKDGSYVVRKDKTGDIIQISNKNDPNWGNICRSYS